MSAVAYAAGVAAVACLILVTVALCVTAGRADATATVPEGVDGRSSQAAADMPLIDDHTAFDARKALRGRRAWVFSAPSAHTGLRLSGRGGTALPPRGEALALRVAAMAISADVPVIVPGLAGGSLEGTALIGVAVPFADGRRGALVVAGGAGMAERPWITHVLQELAVERAELGVPAAPDRRADRFTVAGRRHVQTH
jgi:hypothetical protein